MSDEGYAQKVIDIKNNEPVDMSKVLVINNEDDLKTVLSEAIPNGSLKSEATLDREKKEVLPDGMVRTSTGLARRENVVFPLMEHKEKSNILGAYDGSVYERAKGGTLKRITPKPHILRKMMKLEAKQKKLEQSKVQNEPDRIPAVEESAKEV